MVDEADTPGFTLLGGAGPGSLTRDAVRDLYGYPAGLSQPLVRANAIVSLDGAASTGGTSGGLGGPGDRWLFALQRELADVIVVGAGTARAENYGGVRLTADQRARRRHRGQHEVPPIALVTRTGVLDRELAVLTDGAVPPLVLTCAQAAAGARGRLGSAAEVLDCSAADPAEVDLATALDLLAGRGLLRMLTEGGPRLLGALMARELVDELCLTCAPMLIGGAAVRIATDPVEVLSRMRPAHLLSDDEGYLYTRYIRMR